MKIRKPRIARTDIRQFALELAGILAGALVLSIGMNMFMIPNTLAPGGISGLGVILFHLFSIPVGLTIIILNIPLFIAGYIILGPRVVIHSLMGTVLFSLMVEATARYLPAATADLMLASVYGGVVMGLGMGLVFRFRGSIGGTTLLSLILSFTSGISPGQAILWGDLSVLVAAIFVFGSEAAMYAALALFISSKVIDAVLEGLGLAKSALIITCCGKAINERLISELGRGVTRIEGRGGYSGEGREVLLCVVTRPQTARLKTIIFEEDPQAFFILGNATEVHGGGFKSVSQS